MMIEAVIEMLIEKTISGLVMGGVAIGGAELYKHFNNTDIQKVEYNPDPLQLTMKFNFNIAYMEALGIADVVDICDTSIYATTDKFKHTPQGGGGGHGGAMPISSTPDTLMIGGISYYHQLQMLQYVNPNYPMIQQAPSGASYIGAENSINKTKEKIPLDLEAQKIEEQKTQEPKEKNKIRFYLDLGGIPIYSTDKFVIGWNEEDENIEQFHYSNRFEYVSTPKYRVCFCTYDYYLECAESFTKDKLKETLYFIVKVEDNKVQLLASSVGSVLRTILTIDKKGYIGTPHTSRTFEFVRVLQEFTSFYLFVDKDKIPPYVLSAGSVPMIRNFSFFELLKLYTPSKYHKQINKAYNITFKKTNKKRRGY